MLEKSDPKEEEQYITTDNTIMVKSDHRGIIEYINIEFATISEYGIEELIGEDISVLSHPDMPSTVFNHIWESLFRKKRSYAIVKYLTKSGKFFWLIANIDFKVNVETREIENIYIYYSRASDRAKNELCNLYKKIKNIEIHADYDVAENYLEGYLDEKEQNYDSFIENLIN